VLTGIPDEQRDMNLAGMNGALSRWNHVMLLLSLIGGLHLHISRWLRWSGWLCANGSIWLVGTGDMI
jgi:hypothetical protein